jgi:sortase A
MARITAWTMIWSGSIILGYVGYQMFGTDVVNQQAQAEAQAGLADLLEDRARQIAVSTDTVPDQPDSEPEAEPDPAQQRLIPEPEVATGEPFGAIRIPSIGVDQVIYGGVDRVTLQSGPGHFPGTAMPGQPGNAALSGHRTTHGRPFFDLDQLAPGDVIEVETAVGIHTYAVRESIVVTPFDIWVVEPRDGAWLTLTTCHPKFSARERLIVFAELTGGPNFDYVASA